MKSITNTPHPQPAVGNLAGKSLDPMRPYGADQVIGGSGLTLPAGLPASGPNAEGGQVIPQVEE